MISFLFSFEVYTCYYVLNYNVYLSISARYYTYSLIYSNVSFYIPSKVSYYAFS